MTVLLASGVVALCTVAAGLVPTVVAFGAGLGRRRRRGRCAQRVRSRRWSSCAHRPANRGQVFATARRSRPSRVAAGDPARRLARPAGLTRHGLRRRRVGCRSSSTFGLRRSAVLRVRVRTSRGAAAGRRRPRRSGVGRGLTPSRRTAFGGDGERRSPAGRCSAGPRGPTAPDADRAASGGRRRGPCSTDGTTASSPGPARAQDDHRPVLAAGRRPPRRGPRSTPPRPGPGWPSASGA